MPLGSETGRGCVLLMRTPKFSGSEPLAAGWIRTQVCVALEPILVLPVTLPFKVGLRQDSGGIDLPPPYDNLEDPPPC